MPAIVTATIVFVAIVALIVRTSWDPVLPASSAGPTTITYCRHYTLRVPLAGVLACHRVVSGPLTGSRLWVWCSGASLLGPVGYARINAVVAAWMDRHGIADWRWA